MIPTYEKGSVAKAEYKHLFKVLRKLDEDFSIVNCAPCIHKGGKFNSANIFNFDIVQDDNKPDLKKLVQDYLINDYYTRRTICKTCDKFDSCRGMHINFIRTFGFKTMLPIKEEALQEA